MKKYMMIVLLAFVAPVMAAETDSKSDPGRHVADDLVIQTLLNGDVVTRLVSRSGLSAQQFWTNSVYNPQGFIVVFQGHGGSTHAFNAAHRGQQYEPRIPPKDLALNDQHDILNRVLRSDYIE